MTDIFYNKVDWYLDKPANPDESIIVAQWQQSN